MPNFAFDIAPSLLGVRLMQVDPQWVSMLAMQPNLKHDFSAMRTKTVQLRRHKPWGDRAWTQDARSRNKLQTLGTANSEGLTSSVIELTISEQTGPSTMTGDPSSLWLTREDMEFSQVSLWQNGIQDFHESIGSAALAYDYQGYMDRINILEGLKTTVKVNPGNKADSATLITDKVGANDLTRIRYQLSSRNTQRFADGTYHGIVDELFMSHLFQDPDFKSFALAQMQSGTVPLEQTPMFQGQQSGSALGGVGVLAQQISNAAVPIRWNGFTFWASNNIPKKVVNGLTAGLGLFFGPQAVGYGSGGRGAQIKLNENRDYDRHYRFIWSHWMRAQYLLEDDIYSGCAVEARTFGDV